MSDLPITDTGHRLVGFRTMVQDRGEQTIIVIQLSDKDTGEALPELRWFTGYRGLTLLIERFRETADICRKLMRIGDVAEEPHSHPMAFHYEECTIRPSADGDAFHLNFRTAEGTPFALTIPREAAATLAEQLKKAAQS